MEKHVAVIGAGSWGTALAKLLGEKGHDVCLWAYEPEIAEGINRSRHNPIYLQEYALPETIRATSDLQEALADRSCIISVVPSKALRSVWSRCSSWVDSEALIVSCTKGIEIESLKLMSHVLDECLPSHALSQRIVLSGPSFAKEVAENLPTSVVIAGSEPSACQQVQELFRTKTFLTFTSNDPIGVEIGGAIKNVIALAAGMSDGLQLGNNSRAAIITRGLYETMKIGKSFGASPLTLAGLSGIGDLVLTCTGELSRNHTVGFRLGQGESLNDILKNMVTVAEGIPTAEAVHRLSSERQIKTPICNAVYRILFEGLSLREAMGELCMMPLKEELGAIMEV